MDKNELKIKQDENTITDIPEKKEMVYITNMVTKQKVLQQLVVKEVMKTKLTNVFTI